MTAVKVIPFDGFKGKRHYLYTVFVCDHKMVDGNRCNIMVPILNPIDGKVSVHEQRKQHLRPQGWYHWYGHDVCPVCFYTFNWFDPEAMSKTFIPERRAELTEMIEKRRAYQ